MALTVRHMCEIIHELCPSMGIGVQGLVDGNPVYKYPDSDGAVGDQEASRVELHSAGRMGYTSATVSFDLNNTYCKKEEKMSKEQSKEPVKLSSVLELFNNDEDMNICIELKTGKHVYLHGEADTLRGFDIVQGCIVDNISALDPNNGEEILHIRATQLQGIEIEVSKDIPSNDDPDKKVDDDCIRFGDVVGFKPFSGDITTGIVIDIRDGNAAILYQDRFESRLDVAYKRLEDLRRLKITYSEITEDVMEWLAN